jgi:hypothetical protein
VSQHRFRWSLPGQGLCNGHRRHLYTWIELGWVAEATARTAAELLFQHFGRSLTQIRSDRGPHFANELIKEFLALVGTQH